MSAVYEIKSFRGGISDYEDKGIAGSFKFATNLDIRKREDSLSAGQALVDEGLTEYSLSESRSPSSSQSKTPSPSSSPSSSVSNTPSTSVSPSQTPSASQSPSSSKSPSPSPSAGLTTVFEDLILVFVEGKDGYTYGLGDTGCIYRRTPDGVWTRVYKDPNGKIKGGAEWYSDDKKTWLYWATDTILFKKELPGNPSWNDVVNVGGLSSSEWHTMKEAGGALTIANKEFLAYVGYDGSFTPEALDLIPGNVAKTLVERNGYAIMGTHRASDPDAGINGAIDTEVPLAQVGEDGDIYFANMTDTIPVTRFPGGGKVNPYGVANAVKEVNFFEWDEGASSWEARQAVGNLALFGVYGADTGYNGIYTYGRKAKNMPFVLNLEYKLEVDEIGAVIHTGGTTLVSYKDGTECGVMATDPNHKATATYEGLDFKAPVYAVTVTGRKTTYKQPQDITNWKMAELYFDKLPNGTSIELWYRVDKTGSFVRARVDDGQNSFATANKQKAVFLIGADGQVFEPKVVLNPTGNYTPEVYRIRVYFN
jgi:hypothetical protein